MNETNKTMNNDFLRELARKVNDASEFEYHHFLFYLFLGMIAVWLAMFTIAFAVNNATLAKKLKKSEKFESETSEKLEKFSNFMKKHQELPQKPVPTTAPVMMHTTAITMSPASVHYNPHC